MIVAYCRVSSGKQLEGLSMSLQDDSKMLEEVAKEYNKTVCERVYRDEGKSAFKGENLNGGELAALISDVEKGVIPYGSIIVMRHLNRLSRLKYRDAMSLYSTLLQRVSIYTSMDGFLYNMEAEGKDAWFQDMMAGLAFDTANEEAVRLQYYNFKNAVAQVERFKRGEMHPSGYPYDIGTGQHPVFAEVDSNGIKNPPVKPSQHWNTIKDVVAYALEGNGITKCSEYLKKRGIDYSRTGVRQLLSNPALYGQYTANIDGQKYVLEGYYDFPNVGTICSKAEYHQLQHNFKQRQHSNGARKEYSLLAGGRILHCGCGQFMTVHHGRGGKYYICGSNHNLVPCYVLDHLVMSALSAKVFAMDVDDSTLVALEGELKEKESELLETQEFYSGKNKRRFGAVAEREMDALIEEIERLDSQVESERKKVLMASTDLSLESADEWRKNTLQVITADSDTKLHYHNEIKLRVEDIVVHEDKLIELRYRDSSSDYFYFPESQNRRQGGWYGAKISVVDSEYKSSILEANPELKLSIMTLEDIKHKAYQGDESQFPIKTMYSQPRKASGTRRFADDIKNVLTQSGGSIEYKRASFSAVISPKR